MSGWRKAVFFICVVLGFVTMFWSAQDWYELARGDRLDASFCAINSYWNCDKASLSPLGSMAGIPLGVFGAAWFWVVGVLGLMQNKKNRPFLKVFLISAALVSVILAGYLIFKLSAGCIICYFTYLLIFVLVYVGWKFKGTDLLKPEHAGLVIILGLVGLASFAAVNSSGVDKVIDQEEFELWYESQAMESVPLLSDLKKGKSEAPIKVVEFSDFGCPYCQKAASVLIPYLASQDDVEIIFYPFPLDATCNDKMDRIAHRYSCEWSMAVLCAQEQGKHWSFHDRIFNLAKKYGKLPRISSEIDGFSIDRNLWNECMKNPETERKLRKYIEVGNNLKIDSTPTFFVNGRRIKGFSLPLMRKLLAKFRSE